MQGNRPSAEMYRRAQAAEMILRFEAWRAAHPEQAGVYPDTVAGLDAWAEDNLPPGMVEPSDQAWARAIADSSRDS